MHFSHTLCGLTSGVLLAGALSYPALACPLPVRLLVIPLVGGAALLPDLDHPSAKVAKSLGPVTQALAHGTSQLSLAVYHSTRGPRDPGERRDGHRLLTHTAIGCVGFGVIEALIQVLSHLLMPAFGLDHRLTVLPSVLSLSLVMALNLWWVKDVRRVAKPVAQALNKHVLPELIGEPVKVGVKHLVPIYLLVSSAGAWYVLSYYPSWWWLWPVCVTVGCLTHVAGDACTNTGVPVFWLPWGDGRDGRVWWRWRTWITFETGKAEEIEFVRRALWVLLTLSGLLVTGLLIPIVLGVTHLIQVVAGVG